ncbi:hypothetical protein [Nitratifractor sp.]
MKKSLLLSIAASTLIFAGGDIAPVEPAAPASADFWGEIGFSYQFQDDEGVWDSKNSNYKDDRSMGDKENNAFSTTVVLGVERELGYGFGFGAELAGWTDFGLDIADKSRVESGDRSSAEISQAYLTYSFGNTAVKAGRQALPKALSPWAWSDRSTGVIDWSYDGIVLANTDLAETTLLAAWIDQIYHNSDEQHHVSDGAGLFMLGLVNKSLSDTTISMAAYYVDDSKHDINRAAGASTKDTWSLWANFVTDLDSVKFGLQGAYVDGDYANADATYAIAGKVGSGWGDFDAELLASYINNGDYSLRMAGTGLEDSALWTNYEEDADIFKGQGQAAIMARAGYKLPFGKIYGGIEYTDYDHSNNVGDRENTFGARAGYKFNIAGVDAKVEYRYRDREIRDRRDETRQRVRVEAFYKF